MLRGFWEWVVYKIVGVVEPNLKMNSFKPLRPCLTNLMILSIIGVNFHTDIF